MQVGVVQAAVLVIVVTAGAVLEDQRRMCEPVSPSIAEAINQLTRCSQSSRLESTEASR